MYIIRGALLCVGLCKPVLDIGGGAWELTVLQNLSRTAVPWNDLLAGASLSLGKFTSPC